eukprot:4981266-Amphidinium_carterae.1
MLFAVLSWALTVDTGIGADADSVTAESYTSGGGEREHSHHLHRCIGGARREHDRKGQESRPVEFFEAVPPSELVTSWMTNREQPITLPELYAMVVAKATWSEKVKHRRINWFIDNMGAKIILSCPRGVLRMTTSRISS